MPTLVTAIIRPHALEQVVTALKRAGVLGVTVTEVRGFGRQGGRTETYRGREYQVDFVPKVKVEAVVTDDVTHAIVAVLSDAARTNRIGAGKIWTSPVELLIRIRTGEEGDSAV